MRDKLEIYFSEVQTIKYEQKKDEWYSDAIRLSFALRQKLTCQRA